MKKTICNALTLVFTLTALALPAAAAEKAAPVVIENTWKAEPGDAIGIYGANFSNSEAEARVLLAPMSEYSEDNAFELYDLKILSSDDGVLTAELPKTMSKDNYIGYVKLGESVSTPFYINTPEIDWISEPEICKGQTARIFGRNFLNPKTGDADGAKLYLCSTDAEQVLEAEIKSATEYTVDFVIPSGVTEGKSYIVKYNNGACEYGLSGLKTSEAVPCVSDAQMTELKEMYGVEVAWASNLNLKDVFNVKDYGATGDGDTDDLSAVNSALAAAEANGGGIVYLPAGEYNITSLTDALKIPDKVIIAGEGTDKTVINTDKRISFSENYGGITRLTIKSDKVRAADNTDRLITGIVGWLLYTNNPNICFFAKDMDMKIADGSALRSSGAHHLIIEDCGFDVTHYGPALGWPVGTAPFKSRFVRNYIRNTQRPLLMFGDYTWASDNEMLGENPEQLYEKTNGQVISIEHRITDMWGDNIYFGDNNISGLIGDARADYDDGCGEGICNQQNGRIAVGSAVGAEGNILDTGLDLNAILSGTDSGVGENGKKLIGAKVAVLSGEGKGQIRTVTAIDGSKAILDSKWEVVPKKGDAFTIDCGIPERNIIVNNEITAEVRKAAIMFYCKSANNIIAGNTATSSGGIWFGELQKASQTRTATSYFNYVGDNNLSGGVKDKAGGARDNALSIGPGDDDGVLITVDVSLPKHTSYYGNMYKDNTLNGTGPNVQPSDDYNAKFMSYNGIVVTTPSAASSDYADGTIVSGNTVTNSINGVLVSSLANNTLIYRNNFSGNKNDYNDVLSRNTVIVTGDDAHAEAVRINSSEAGIAAAANLEKNPQTKSEDKPVLENSYTDIDEHWAKENILLLSSLGILNGYEDNTFRPNESITRAEFISLVQRCSGLQLEGYKYQGLFNDVSKSSWYGTTMEKAFLLGFIDKNMVDGWKLYPEKKITREEMVSVVVAGLEAKDLTLEEREINGFKDSESVTPWAESSMRKAYNAQIITGNDKNELNPVISSTRAEAVVVLERMLILLNN